MVEEVKVNNRYFLINAPAGSGKTTFITNKITEILSKERKIEQVLCITYTNRAADELTERLSSQRIEVSTIHSFLNRFIAPFLRNTEVIKYFQSHFELQIEDERKELDKDNIKEIKRIKYNELQYSKYSQGELSHDDLLEFSYSLIRKFTVIRKKLWKYSYVFIDEYQDTSANVLRFFYDGLKDARTKLYLLGDRMQQIYDNYDGSFENELQQFSDDKKLRDNYRSSKSIVALLNEIYNESDFEQTSKNNKVIERKPEIHIKSDVDKFLRDFKKDNPESLMLVLANRERFKEIDATELYNAYSSMEDYGYASRYGATEVLTMKDENPDNLLNLLFKMKELCKGFEEQKYGKVIRNLKKHSFFNGKLLINYHQDKILFAGKIKEINDSSYKDITIEEWLNVWIKCELVHETYVNEIIESEKYAKAIKVNLDKFNKLTEYLEQPYVSTQHGVKGEGHNEVLFVVDEMTRGLNVRMYELFSMWSKIDINFISFEKFYFDYMLKISQLQKEIEKKIGNKFHTLKSTGYYNSELTQFISNYVSVIYDDFKNNDYFIYLYEQIYEDFFGKEKNWTHFKNLLKTSKLKGLMNAYKLFYVGCSRAKEKLTVVMKKEKLKDEGEIVEKFQELGFEVITND